MQPLELTLSNLIPPTNHGDRHSSEALFAALYRELRGLARRELARSGPGASLGATSLIHEAYLVPVQKSTFPGTDYYGIEDDSG